MSILTRFTLADVKAVRDNAWMQRQQAYHDAAMKDVNDTVRKYNAIAPYAVRRPYYDRQKEVERLYEACAEDILGELQSRLSGKDEETNATSPPPKIPDGTPLDLKTLWRVLVSKFVGLFTRSRRNVS